MFLIKNFLLIVCIISCSKTDTKSDAKDIIAFTLEEQTQEAVINPADYTISLEVGITTDLSTLAPTIVLSENAISEPASGDTVDFSKGEVTYKVTAEDGTTQDWAVSVYLVKSSEAEILNFELSDQTKNAVISGDSITIEVGPEAEIKSMAPTIAVSPGAIIEPKSGDSIDFSNCPVIYTVTSTDGTVRQWKITVIKPPNYRNFIVSFSVPGQVGETVYETSVIKLEVPFNSDLMSVKPEIVVSKYATVAPASGEAVDFSNGSVEYTVTSEEGYSRFYKVYLSYAVISADNPYYQYTGRINFSNPKEPVFWAPGVYIKAKYKGVSCVIAMDDELLYGTSKNYLEIVVDDNPPYRIQTTDRQNNIVVGANLTYGEHTITICKNTEAGIGYLKFRGLSCEELLPLPMKPERKMEFIGNSITCGTGSDLSIVACGANQWYDQHNAYMSYGPLTARALDAQWHITAVSGIGVIHSCCDMTVVMPDVFDKVNFKDNSITWDFSKYIPDVVTICLGQNDGIQDSVEFCSAYANFIKSIRSHYPQAEIVCLTSPMADNTLVAVMKNYLTGIVNALHAEGDTKVHKFYFSKSFNSGCDGHPDLAEHQLIANELTVYVKTLMGW